MMYFDSRAWITLNTGQQFVDQLLFGFFHFTIALDKAGFRAVDNFDFAQAVCFQRGTGGNQIANRIRQSGTRGDFNRTVQ